MPMMFLFAISFFITSISFLHSV